LQFASFKPGHSLMFCRRLFPGQSSLFFSATAVSNCDTPKAHPLSGFFLNRGPRRPVFVAGVEVKATSHGAGKGT
jgi:hypothetical protein